METICANPADTLMIPHWFLWLCVLIGMVAGAIIGYVACHHDRKKLQQADELLLKVHTAAQDPTAWRMPRRLLREIADFLGMP